MQALRVRTLLGIFVAASLAIPFCFSATGSHAEDQYPIMSAIAQKVIQKYQTSSCQELAAERSHPKTGAKEPMKQRLVKLLHEDAGMRKAFLDKVAAPIANKLFECGLIP